MKIVITFIVGLVIGIASTFGVMHYLFKDKVIPVASATVTPISGSPLSVNKITYDKNQTTINTSYTGSGESDITIPDKINPSANAWNNYRWSVGGSYSIDNTMTMLCGYRYERVMFIAGLWYRNSNSYAAGLEVGAMYLFEPSEVMRFFKK